MQKFWTNLKDFMGGACHGFPSKVVQGVKYIHTGAKSFMMVLFLLEKNSSRGVFQCEKATGV